jgi:hypothetical protein
VVPALRKLRKGRGTPLLVTSAKIKSPGHRFFLYVLRDQDHIVAARSSITMVNAIHTTQGPARLWPQTAELQGKQMSVKTLSWILLAAITLGAVLLFNDWASYQLLSTLAYAGIVAALLEPGASFSVSGCPQTSRRSAYSRGWRGLNPCGSILAGFDNPCRAIQNPARRHHAGVPVLREALGQHSCPARAGDAGCSPVNVRRHEIPGHAPENSWSGLAHS